jgi:hypothetical protein
MIRAEPVAFEPSRPPAWARPSGSFRDHSEAEALYFAGAALAALDSVAKSDPPWAGVWRRRLALKSAAAAAQNLCRAALKRGLIRSWCKVTATTCRNRQRTRDNQLWWGCTAQHHDRRD